eukprot:10881740-Ditylum_brightwellii.AAC.1
MRERGEGCVDNESEIKTPVEAQWVLTLGSTAFNVIAHCHSKRYYLYQDWRNDSSSARSSQPPHSKRFHSGIQGGTKRRAK